ncbi:hypothetical protein GCM10009858_44010 [Terrabacter carboxydivorans]|uniref:Uncharacterized protein n=1 Tax=Terrabacter carboxydivorans TaxID=619730 RepID=A0ABN3MIS1_9MICO
MSRLVDCDERGTAAARGIDHRPATRLIHSEHRPVTGDTERGLLRPRVTRPKVAPEPHPLVGLPETPEAPRPAASCAWRPVQLGDDRGECLAGTPNTKYE